MFGKRLLSRLREQSKPEAKQRGRPLGRARGPKRRRVSLWNAFAEQTAGKGGNKGGANLKDGSQHVEKDMSEAEKQPHVDVAMARPGWGLARKPIDRH